MRKNSLPLKGIFFGVATSVVILLVIQKIFGAKIDLDLLKNAWNVVFSAIFVLLFSWCISALRIMLLLRTLNNRLSYFRSYRSIVLSFFFSAITPFAAGGQPFQIYDLTRAKIPVSNASAAVISQYLMTNFATAFLAILLLPHYLTFFSKLETLGTVFAIGILITVGAGIFFTILALSRKMLIGFLNFLSRRKLLFKIVCKLTKKEKKEILEDIREKFKSYNDGMRNIWSKKPLTLFNDFLLAIGYLLTSYGVFYIVMVGLLSPGTEYSFSFIDSVVAQVLLSFVVYFIPTPGSSGGFESGMFAMLKNMLPDQQLIIGISIWRFVTYHFLILIGLLSFLLNFGKKPPKELTRT